MIIGDLDIDEGWDSDGDLNIGLCNESCWLTREEVIKLRNYLSKVLDVE